MTYSNDLREVNDEINALPYMSDAERYRQPEFWARADAEGSDCEDMALGKLNALHKRGWDISRMRLGTVLTEQGEHHAVLHVTDKDGTEYVLDNRYNKPVTLTELQRIGYVPQAIQKAGGDLNWVEWRWA